MIIVYKKLNETCRGPNKDTHFFHLFTTFLLGKQLLGLADKIEPGMTKWRGQLLFEMQSATVVLAQRALKEGKLKRFQAQVTYHHTSSHQGVFIVVFFIL